MHFTASRSGLSAQVMVDFFEHYMTRTLWRITTVKRRLHLIKIIAHAEISD